MSPTHLLDTSWIIRHLRGSKPYSQTIYQFDPSELAVSIISIAELYEGIARSSDPDAARKLDYFLEDKTLLTLTPPICTLFGYEKARLRRQNQLIGDMDLFIAVTCLHHNLTILTTNPRHFERVPGISIISSPLP